MASKAETTDAAKPGKGGIGRLIMTGILMLPVTLAFGPIVAFNTLTLLTFVAAAWSAAILSETIVPHRFGAWVAGALYTYAPFHVWLAGPAGHRPRH